MRHQIHVMQNPERLLFSMRRFIYVLACTALALSITSMPCFANEGNGGDVPDDVTTAANAASLAVNDEGAETSGEALQQDPLTNDDPLENGTSEAVTEQPPLENHSEATEQESATDVIDADSETNEYEAADDDASGSNCADHDVENGAENDGEAIVADSLDNGAPSAVDHAAENNVKIEEPAIAVASADKAPAAKPAKKATAAKDYLANNAIYYISTALKKKGAYTVSLKDILGKSKTNVVLAKKATQLIQYWRVETKGDGIYRFVNCASGYYLAVKGTVKSKANVYVNKKGAIDWKLKKNADGTFSLRPATGGKAYISVAGGSAKKGANIRLWGSVSNNAQRFVFTKSKRLTKAFEKGKTVEPGIVKIKVAGSKTPIYVVNSTKRNNNKTKTAAGADTLKQVYQMRYKGNGLYEFQNANSYKVLAVYKNSKLAGTKVVQYKRSLGLNQLWYFNKVDGGYQLVSARNGLAIDIADGKSVSGKGIQMAKPSKASSQKFTFEEAKLVPNGTYVFQSAMALPMVLSVHGSSKADGANVELARSSGAKGEKFKVKYLKNGIYRITNASTKKSIEVANSSKKSGANIQMASANGDANQQWIIEVGESGLMLKSVRSGKYLNVHSSQAKRGANVDQRIASGEANQCWTLAPSDWKFYAGATSSAMKLINKAETYEGWRYYWGGRDPSTSFDCAGLVMYCSNKAWGTHFDLMNTNAEMLYEKCTHISAADAKPGDLVFYRGTYGNDVTYISHVVIYAGNGYMYGAGDPIGYAKVNSIKNIYGNKAKAVYARIRH